VPGPTVVTTSIFALISPHPASVGTRVDSPRDPPTNRGLSALERRFGCGDLGSGEAFFRGCGCLALLAAGAMLAFAVRGAPLQGVSPTPHGSRGDRARARSRARSQAGTESRRRHQNLSRAQPEATYSATDEDISAPTYTPSRPALTPQSTKRTWSKASGTTESERPPSRPLCDGRRHRCPRGSDPRARGR